VKNKRLKDCFQYIDSFCIQHNEDKDDVLFTLLKEHLAQSGYSNKVALLMEIKQGKTDPMSVDQCLALRVEKLQSKNQYKTIYSQINQNILHPVLQAPKALDIREKSYMPPSARWSLLDSSTEDDVLLHHTPARIKPTAEQIASSSSISNFEPIDILHDFYSFLPELPLPNCKGLRWSYADALAQTLAELDDEIISGFEARAIDHLDESRNLTVFVKDGADGMGDVGRYSEKSDRFLPEKALRFSFAIVKVTTESDDGQIPIFIEKSPNSVRVNRPLMIAIADENFKSTNTVCLAPIEQERDKTMLVNIASSGIHRRYSFKFYSSMVDEKFDRSGGGLQGSGSKYICTLCHATRASAKETFGSFKITRTRSEAVEIARMLRFNPKKLTEKQMEAINVGVKTEPILLSEPINRGIDATHTDINMSSFFKTLIIRVCWSEKMGSIPRHKDPIGRCNSQI
jgi:V(D)J recombination-activating protein 1